jgi:hypothetical protein
MSIGSNSSLSTSFAFLKTGKGAFVGFGDISGELSEEALREDDLEGRVRKVEGFDGIWTGRLYLSRRDLTHDQRDLVRNII